MVKVICTVCQEHYVLSKFLFLACGHGFCTRCTQAMSQRPNCAFCNTPKGRVEPHPIYVNFAISPLEKMAEVAEGLSRINQNAPAASIKKASEKIKGVMPAIRSADVEAKLVAAAEGIEQTVYPVFSRMDEMSKEMSALAETISELERKNRALEKEKDSMKGAIEHLNTSGASSQERHALLAQSHAENSRLMKKLERRGHELSAKEAELVSLRQLNDDKDKRIRLLNTKLKALVRQGRRDQEHRPAVSNADDSLMIVDTPEVGPSSQVFIDATLQGTQVHLRMPREGYSGSLSLTVNTRR